MVNKHRFYVFCYCTRCGQFWRGLTHDLSKYSFTEFWEGVKYYNGKFSPIASCRKEKGYSLAWLHHKGHNKHHYLYWIDPQNKRQMNMPYKYAVEFICDHIAATKCYSGKDYKDEMILEYFLKHEKTKIPNEEMVAFYEKVFTDLKNYGKKKVLNKKYLKTNYKEIVENHKIVKGE